MSTPSTASIALRQDGPSTLPCQKEGWWEVERARFIRRRVRKMISPDALIADLGCGRGQLLGNGSLPARIVVNVDSHIWDEWKHCAGILHVCASTDALPFRAGAFDLVGSFDVLEHLPDDVSGLREQTRVVRPGGRVVTAVPADERLWSPHDEAVGHHRRYSPDSFRSLSQTVGLHIDSTTHFFSFLWPPAWLTRQASSSC